ncbi:MAG TPA: phosphoribosylamine--glycine ligase [Chthoniobacterales bacterium]
MKVLIIGSGGREHALAWKIGQSPRVSEVFCAPGNGGTAAVAKNVPIPVTNIAALRDFALSEKIDLTVVGPDDVLASGAVDIFQAAGLRIFGPTKSAARLESSKVFAKEFMERHGIPTAKSARFSNSDEARSFCRKMGAPLVVKADGLALGKGVIIAQTSGEAEEAIARIMDQREFGAAGEAVVVEEFLQGEECSIHALIDGSTWSLFPGAQDHKRVFDGDAGPNTGGMGTCSPVPALDSALIERVKTEVLDRFIAGIRADGIDFRGMLFPGLILTADGPKVLEFNCRFGDPETQVLLPRLKTDFVDLLEATVDGSLARAQPEWDDRAAVCVVMASGGYPGKYATGEPISGLEAAAEMGAIVFHAGTKPSESGDILTSGGRVLGVTALGDDVRAAREAAYAAVAEIDFADRQYRSDIGLRSVR